MKKQLQYKIIALLLTVCVAGAILNGCGSDVTQEGSQTVEATGDADSVNEGLEVSEVDIEEAKKAEDEAKKAEEEARKLEEEAKRVEEEARKAEEEAKAEEERLKAEAEAKKAEEERLKAEADAKKAEEERLKAEAEAKKAEEERQKAEEEAASALTPTQLTSINMLNYMTVLTQEINTSKGNQMFLEAARTSLYNDTNLKAVDTSTQAQIKQLVSIIDQYRMVDVKRERLEFIYEQNQAQAIRQAIPNPMGLLSAVQSGSLLKGIASVVYMAVDSASSYKSAKNQAEIQFIKEGWELDDTETKVLQDSTTAQFDYMCNMVRNYDLPDEYVVRDTDVKAFVEWSNKTNLQAKIDWLKANEKTYQKFGPYWLELVKDYYEMTEYDNCLNAIAQYEEISAKITRKDDDYARVLPMVIISMKETLSQKDYIEKSRAYCKAIIDNTKDEDWALRYFAAQIYIDIYGQSKKTEDLKSAYDIAYYNANTLVDEQRDLNDKYLAPVVEEEAEKGATKREKKEIKQYNRLIKEERKVAVPPISEALYLNCDMLFAIAEQINIDATEKNRIERLLHENGEDLFLTKALDNRFRYGKDVDELNADDVALSFNGERIIIPAICISDRSQVIVDIKGDVDDTLDDWKVSEVKRPKESDCAEYLVTLNSKKGKDHKYQVGEVITIKVIPVVESPEDSIVFSYEVIPDKKAFVFNGIAFERK
ncbi:MAG: hypothetical protein IJ608_00590 [Lachnospiraceae bacterium]|nr:hypothetical protein [Lachnospiraceae bacterium]